jgi:uncharacterized protein (DUF433 family)
MFVMKASKSYKNRIFVDPSVHFGRPCIVDTRIPVEAILELVEESIPFEEIVNRYYPDIEIEDIKACIRYARDIVESEEIHVGSGA